MDVRRELPEKIKMTIVADREADIFDLFHEHQAGKLGTNTEILIRACRDRKIEMGKTFLFKAISMWKVRGEYNLSVGSNSKRKARTATMEVRFEKISMSVPKQHSKTKFQNVNEIFVIDVHEKNVPADETPIHWTLLTTWQIQSIKDAIEKVEWYQCRWFIEELFRILKSGQKVEYVKFDTSHALMNWCALKLMMAIRILCLLKLRHSEESGLAGVNKIGGGFNRI